MTLKRILRTLLIGVTFIGQVACSARNADESAYETGLGGIAEDATATDRAETTVAAIDTAALILPSDTAKVR